MARIKQMRMVIAFDTTDAALRMEQCCREDGLPGRLIPLPTQISAGCGLAWSAPVEAETELLSELSNRSIDHVGSFIVIL